MRTILDKTAWPRYEQHPSTDQFVSCCGLMKQSAMVHKRPPAAGDSPAATASERLHVASIYRQIAEELGVREQQVEATVALLDGGATVPFVARYRKEITGALDDVQLRKLEERLNYLRELEERRIAILSSVREQGKLDAALEAAILGGDSRGRVEGVSFRVKPEGRQQGSSRRHLPPVQAEAPHQGRDRQRGGAGAACRLVADAAGERSAGRGRTVPQCRSAGGRGRGRARGGGRHSKRTA